MLDHRIAATLLVGSALLACPPTAKIEFFNHTAHTIVVAYFDTTKSIAPGESDSFRIPGHGGRFEIYFHDGVREYAVPLRDVPSDAFRNFWGGLYRVQLEADRRLFLLGRGQHSPRPIRELVQPPGFPLEPEPPGKLPDTAGQPLGQSGVVASQRKTDPLDGRS